MLSTNVFSRGGAQIIPMLGLVLTWDHNIGDD